MLRADPVLQELNRRLVTEGGMTAIPVVERFDVVQQAGRSFRPLVLHDHLALLAAPVLRAHQPRLAFLRNHARVSAFVVEYGAL